MITDALAWIAAHQNEDFCAELIYVNDTGHGITLPRLNRGE